MGSLILKTTGVIVKRGAGATTQPLPCPVRGFALGNVLVFQKT